MAESKESKIQVVKDIQIFNISIHPHSASLLISAEGTIVIYISGGTSQIFLLYCKAVSNTIFWPKLFFWGGITGEASGIKYNSDNECHGENSSEFSMDSLLPFLTNSHLACCLSWQTPLSVMKVAAQAGFLVLQRATQQRNWRIQTILMARWEQSVFLQYTCQTNTLTSSPFTTQNLYWVQTPFSFLSTQL